MSSRNAAAATAVPSIVMSLNAAADRAVAGMGLGRSGRGGLNVETLEGRVLMAGQPAADSSMAYDAVGNLHVAYYDAAAKHLKYTRQATSGAWTAPAVIDASSADVGRSASLAVDKLGRPGVAYYDAANQDLRYAYLENGTAWKTVAVDTKGAVGQNPSLAFDAKNVAAISYYKQDSGDLRLATLKSLAKNKWSVSTIAKKGDVGQFSSLAIDPATNRPVVAFADADGRVQFLSKKAGGFNKPVVVEDLPGAATNVDVAIGANGRPAISYFDPAAGAIKLAETGDAKARSFTTQAVADVPAGSNPNPTLLIDPVTKVAQVVYFDAGADGVFVASKAAGTAGEVETKQLKAGGGEGFVAAVQPGNNSISFAVVDNTGTGGSAGPVDLGNTETTPVAPTGVGASASGEGEVAVSWADNSDNETAFVVERSTDGQTFADIGQSEPNQSLYYDTAADEATTYHYRVRATGGAGKSATTNSVATVTTLAKAPTNLTATAVAADQIDLAWTNASKAATGNVVERSVTGSEQWGGIVALGASATSFVDTDVDEDTGYSYRVVATFGGKKSVASAVAAAFTKPAVPTGLTVTQVSPTRLDLAWTNASKSATGTQIQRSTDGQTWTNVVSLGAAATTYDNTGLTEGTAYQYRIRAMGEVAGDYSEAVNATTNPAVPANVAAVADSTTQITLTWTDGSQNETGYVVERAVTGGQYAVAATVGANVTTFTDTGRSEGVSYSYKVKAVIAGQAEATSAVVTTTTLPSAPTDFAATLAANGTKVQLTWNDNAAGETGYQVQHAAGGSEAWTTLTTTATNATAFTDAAAAEGTSYDYRVRAVNAAGESAFATDAATTVPAKPTGLTVSAPTTTGLTLNWADGSTGETGFVVERSTDGGDFAQVGTTAANVTTFADAGLSTAATYTYRVRAVNAGGSSAFTAEVAGTTLTAAPANLAVAATTDQQVDLTWSAAAGASYYKVERLLDGDTEWDEVGQSDVPSFGDVQVTEATGYTYRVRAVNAGGDSAASNTVAVATRPTAPGNLGVTATTIGSVSLAWADRSLAETGFTVERSSAGGDFAAVFTAAPGATTYTDSNLDEGTSYAYRVRATGAGGASAYSNEAAAVTNPAAPTNASAAATSATAVTVSWTDVSGHETGYEVEVSTDGGANFTQAGLANAGGTSFAATVAEGTSPVFRVRAAVNGVYSAYATAAAVETPPAAPSASAAASLTAESIKVTWTDNSAAETGYRIERSLDGVSFVQVGTAAANATEYTDTGLDEGTAYTYRVRATMAELRNSGYAVAVTATTRPAAPTNLSAALVAGGVDLSWTNASVNADSYSVERSADAGTTWTAVGTSPTTSYSDTSTSAGLTYSYRVSAVNEGGASAASTAAVATLVPATPGSVGAAVLPGGDKVRVTWADVAGETDYKLFRTDDAGANWTLLTTLTAGTTQHDDATVTESASYGYRLRAVNASGESVDSAEVTVNTALVTPTGAAAVAGGTNSVTITWQDNSSAEASYLVERSVNGGDTWADAGTAAANALTFTDNAAMDGVAHLYRVTAKNGPVASNPSATAAATTPLLAVTSLTGTSVSAARIDLAWMEPGTNHAGVQIERSEDGTNFTQINYVSAGVGSYSDTGLDEAKTYHYRVRTANTVATSAYEGVARTTRPVAVSGVAVTATGETSVSLSWTNHSAANTGYAVDKSTDNGATWTSAGTIADPAVLTFNASGLTEGTSYRFRVAATNAGGTSAWSDSVAAATPPAAPAGVAAASAMATQVNVTWTDASNGETGYKVERSPDGTDWATLNDTLPAGSASYTDNTVTAATAYVYRVTALGTAGNSAGVTAAVTTVPASVGDTSATVVSTTQVNLAWADVAGNTGYRVERKEGAGVFAQIATGLSADATGYNDTTALEGRSYEYRVFATSAAGESAAGNAATAVTPPAVPSTLAATDTNATTIRLTWADNSAAETAVKVQRLDGADWTTIATLAADVVSYDDTVAPGSTHTYRVFVTAAGGDSGLSATATATTVPAQVTGVTAAAAGATSVNVGWTPVAGATGYKVFRSDNGGTTFAQAGSDLAANAVSYADAGRTEATPYVYNVVAFNASGDAAASANVAATTLPAAPTDFQIDGFLGNGISISWTDSSLGETGFVVYRSVDGGAFAELATPAANAVFYVDNAVTPGVSHAYKVATRNGAAESAAAGPESIIALPGTPAAPTVTATSASAVTVIWSAPAGAVTGYKIYRDGGDGNGFVPYDLVGASGTSYADANLSEATAYSYKVSAVNTSGEGDASPAGTATTRPAAPTGVGSMAVNATDLSVTWTDNSAGENGFEVERSADGGTTWVPAGTAASTGGTGGPGTRTDSGLTEATTYAYRVRATDAAGQFSEWSASHAVDTDPVAPATLAVTAVTDTSVSIQWADSSAGEGGYEVERSVDGGTNWATIATPAANATTYTDAGRSQSSDYVYRVRAVRGASASAYSPNATATTLPAAPTTLAASATSPTSVALTWADNASAEDGYRVERSTDGTTWSLIHTTAAGATGYTDAAAPESAPVAYRVRAYKGAAASADSNVAAVITPVAVPTGLVAAATAHDAVRVTWTDTSNVETGFRVERSPAGLNDWFTVALVGAGVGQYDDAGRTEDTGYDYRVFAQRAGLDSPPTATAAVKTPLAAPAALTSASPTATSVALAWTNASTAATNVVVDRRSGGAWATVATLAGTATAYTDATVAEGTAYEYRIHAAKMGNASANVGPAAVTTLPAAPTSLSVAAFSTSQIDLAWTDTAGGETAYKVERSENGGPYAVVATLAPNAAAYSDLAAHEGGTFAYLVYAVGTGGNSATATGSLTTAPAAPTAVAATPVTATRIDLGWTDNSGGETNYVVERSTDGGSTWAALATLAPNVSAYSDTTAGEARTHHYQVRAVRDGVASAWVGANATTVPAAPTGLTAAVPLNANKVNLGWTDASTGETGYEVERSTDGGATWSLVHTGAANATAHSDVDNVAEGTTYAYRVRATSSAGNSDWSNVATAATLPAAPTNLTGTATSATSVTLAWTDASSNETGFTVERSANGGGTWTPVATMLAGSAGYTDNTASEGATFQYRVRAFTAAAVGNPGNTVTVSTPLAAPTELAAAAVSPSQVSLTWRDNSVARANYKVERSTDNGTTWAPLTTVVGNSHLDTTVVAGATYVYQLRATRDGGDVVSAYATSNPVATAPTAPGPVTATAVAHDAVALTWADAQGEAAYTVERSANNGTTWSVRATNVAANAPGYTDTGTGENLTYVYRVKATNAAGASAYVTSAAVTTLPAAPADVDANTVSPDTITLTWTDRSGIETGYKVERREQGAGDGAWVQLTSEPLAAGTQAYTDPTGAESTGYEYRVRAVSGGRHSAYSFTAAATTLPVRPTSLTAPAKTATSATLAWSNTSRAPTILVERSVDGGLTFTTAGSVGQGGNEFTDTGLTAGNTYVYRVRGFNGDGGFSNPSDTVIVSLPLA